MITKENPETYAQGIFLSYLVLKMCDFSAHWELCRSVVVVFVVVRFYAKITNPIK